MLDSGIVGDIVTLNANEGVMPWHQAHSFVRGHWSVTGKSTPMIVAKCCHDMDIIPWLVGRECCEVFSRGSLKYFRPENAPQDAPQRCSDGCPVGGDCYYNASRYAGDMRSPWLSQVFHDSKETSENEILDWLKTSPWGRCVYRCDNDAVDHQVVCMEFEAGITATFTMTAFESGRHIEVYGTRGILRGGEFYKKHCGSDIVVELHSGETKRYSIELEKNAGYDFHGGGDAGLIAALYDEMSPENQRLSNADPFHSHYVAFSAEHSRATGEVVDVKSYTDFGMNRQG